MTLRKAAFRQLGDELFTGERLLPLLRAAWPLAVGKGLAERTRPLALQGRVLLVEVPDGRWRWNLHRLRREILAKLWEVAGSRAPTALGFVESRATAEPPPDAPIAPPVERAPPPVGAALRAQAAGIADPDLRESFLRTAARYLARSDRQS